MTRTYQKKKRAEREAETRRRIVEATVALHTSIGPARTTISAIAEKAGVQRHTVYSHFPDEATLFAACTTHWAQLHPFPPGEPWKTAADPLERVALALRDAFVGAVERLALGEIGLVRGEEGQAGVIGGTQCLGIEHGVEMAHRRPHSGNAVVQLFERLHDVAEGGRPDGGELVDARPACREYLALCKHHQVLAHLEPVGKVDIRRGEIEPGQHAMAMA